MRPVRITASTWRESSFICGFHIPAWTMTWVRDAQALMTRGILGSPGEAPERWSPLRSRT